MVNDVINMINASKSFLVISSFFLAHTDIENALIKAANNGVRCYVMFATNVRLQQEGANDEFTKKAYERHSETLRKLAGKVLIHASNNFHAKIILCDPNTEPSNFSQNILEFVFQLFSLICCNTVKNN